MTALIDPTVPGEMALEDTTGESWVLAWTHTDDVGLERFRLHAHRAESRHRVRPGWTTDPADVAKLDRFARLAGLPGVEWLKDGRAALLTPWKGRQRPASEVAA